MINTLGATFQHDVTDRDLPNINIVRDTGWSGRHRGCLQPACLSSSSPPSFPNPEEEACHARGRSKSRHGLVRPSRPFLGRRCQLFGIAWGAGPRLSERWG